MKKFLLILLILSFIITVGTGISGYATENTETILFFDDFDDTDNIKAQTSIYTFGGATATTVNEAGRGRVVKILEQNGKRLYIKPEAVDKNYSNQSQANALPFEKVRFECDVKLDVGATVMLRARTYDSLSDFLLFHMHDGEIHAFGTNGEVVATYGTGWHSVRVDIDSVNNDIDMYLDGTPIVTNAESKELVKDIRGVVSFGLYGRNDPDTTDDYKYYYTDNYKMTSLSFGKKISKCDEYHKVLFEDNFDDRVKIHKLTDTYNFGAATIEAIEEEGRGKVAKILEENGKRLYIKPTAVDINHADINEENSKPFKKVRLEFDIKLDNNTVAQLHYMPYNSSSSEITILDFRSGNIRLFSKYGTTISTYDAEWHSFRVEIDSENNDIDVYMDNETIAENVSSDSLVRDIRGVVSFGIYAVKETTDTTTSYLYLDNYRLTSASAMPLIEIEGDNLGTVSYCLMPEYEGSAATLITSVTNNGVVTDIRAVSAEPGADPLKLSIDYSLSRGDELKAFCLDFNGNIISNSKPVEHKAITEEDCEEILNRWRDNILEEGGDITDTYVAKAINTTGNTARSSYNLINLEPDAKVLFGDTEVTTTAQMARQFKYILRMAKGYAATGSKVYGQEEYKDAILYGFEWMYENLYGQDEIDGVGWKNTEDYNWYDWFIDGPRDLIDAIIIMREHLTDEEIRKYLSLYDHLSKWMSTGDEVADKLARTYNSMAYSLLTKDAVRARELVADMNDVLKISENGQGFKQDGMYICHGAHPYTGLYGINLLVGRIIPLYEILYGSALEMNPENTDMVMRTLKETFMPSLYKGKMMSSLMGRSRGTTEETYEGGQTIKAAVMIYEYVDEEDKAFIRRFIKLNSPGVSPYDKYYSHIPNQKMAFLKEIAEDNSPVEPYEFARLYYTGDRVMWHHGDATVSLAMSSERIHTYESINDANKDGWFTGDGMLYVYSGDNYATQYTGEYWSDIDMAHMPGTTEDVRERQKISVTNTNLNEYRKTLPSFVGGVTYDDNYITAAMDFRGYNYSSESVGSSSEYGGGLEVFSSTLKAKKSWFMFDDEVVALGSNVSSNDNSEVRTYVTNYLLADDETVSKGSNWLSFSKGATYLFPSGEMPISKTTENGFYETHFSHGINPSNDSYAYAILPNGFKRSDYATNPDFEILSQNNKVHAVRENSLGITGMVFWEAGEFEGVEVSEPIVLMISQAGGKTILKVADPTQKLNSVTVTVNGKSVVFDLSECSGETIEKAI